MKFLLTSSNAYRARDAFHPLGVARSGIDLHRALRTGERHFHDGALVGHQRGERHDFVFVDRKAVPNASLGRQPVVAVLGAPCPDHLDPSVALSDREIEAVQAVAALNLLQQPSRMGCQYRRALEIA